MWEGSKLATRRGAAWSVATDEWATLQPEVRREPRLALDGGPDGLVLIRRLILQSEKVLSSGGRLFLEVGQGQAGDVVRLLEQSGFQETVMAKDLAGVDRFVMGVRP